jgi:micrococcal nuclease
VSAALPVALPGALGWLISSLVGALHPGADASLLAQRQQRPPPLPALPPLPPPPPPAAARVRSATVLSVRNGQELRVVMAGAELPRRVRLACVQAPRPSQIPWAEQARSQLREALPAGSEVSLELRGRDDHNRELALVRRNGRDVTIPLLESGALFHNDGIGGSCANLSYRAVEGMARGRAVGVWSVPGGIERPWLLLLRQADPSDEP